MSSLGYSSSNPVEDFKNYTFPLNAELLKKMGIDTIGDDLISSRKSMVAKGAKEEDWTPSCGTSGASARVACCSSCLVAWWFAEEH